MFSKINKNTVIKILLLISFVAVALTIYFIRFHNVKTVVVKIDEKSKRYNTKLKTVKELIEKEKIEYKKEDRIEPKLETELKDGLVIQIDKALKISFRDGVDKKEIFVVEKSVKDFFEKNNIIIKQKDILSHKIDSAIVEGMKLEIDRVEVKEEIKKEITDFKIKEEKDESLKKGERKVSIKGEKGQLNHIMEVTYKNGKKIKESLKKTETIKKPVDEIVLVGTNEKKDKKKQ